MRRITSVLFAAALAAGGGLLVFQTLRADAGHFNGTINGATRGGADLTASDVITVLLGEALSLDHIVLSQADPTKDGITLNSARLRWAPATVNNNAYCEWDTGLGLSCASNIAGAPGGTGLFDNLQSRQQDRPPAASDSHGFQFTPQSSIGTCGTTAFPRGDHVVLSDAANDRPCDCLMVGSALAWTNSRCPSESGTTTVCPACP